MTADAAMRRLARRWPSLARAAVAALLLLRPSAAAAQSARGDSSGVRAVVVVTGMVIDGSSGLPVPFAIVQGAAARVTTDATGAFRLAVALGDTLRIRRLGYHERRASVDGATLRVVLLPLAARLVAVQVRADEASVASAPRLGAARDVAGLRAAGAASVEDALARLPFVTTRGARGELALSMRGSRAEQVMVTLDGMPLNDPATGRADVGDVPLAALGMLGAAPGADPVTAGPGASGGVLALTSDTTSVLTVGAGSFGHGRIEGAWSAPVAQGQLRVGAGLSRARNDYRFVNAAAATGADAVERRINNDERRLSGFVSATLPRVQVLVLASEAQQGMVGPMNVRIHDAARGTRRRLLVRAAVAPSRWSLAAGLRAFTLAYRDPPQPSFASDAGALSLDGTAERGIGAVALRAGLGLDRATGTGIDRQTRPRAFAAVSTGGARGPWRARAGLRADALRGERVQPSLEAGVERTGRLSPFARAAQAFRAPTLQDLFFASPQRIVARPLRPERVALDGELGIRLRSGPALFSGSAFVRRTHSAIVWFPSSIGWSPQNVDRERVEGAEASALWTASSVELRAWGGRYRTRLFAGALVLPTPYVAYSAGGAAAVARHGARSLATTLRLSDRRPFAIAPAARATELPGTALLDAHLSWSFTRMRTVALLTIGAENVGDVAWQPVLGYPAPGRSWSAVLTLTP